jgi:hypothetical protein
MGESTWKYLKPHGETIEINDDDISWRIISNNQTCGYKKFNGKLSALMKMAREAKNIEQFVEMEAKHFVASL